MTKKPPHVWVVELSHNSKAEGKYWAPTSVATPISEEDGELLRCQRFHKSWRYRTRVVRYVREEK